MCHDRRLFPETTQFSSLVGPAFSTRCRKHLVYVWVIFNEEILFGGTLPFV